MDHGISRFHAGVDLKASYGSATWCKVKVGTAPTSSWSLTLPANPPAASSTWAIDSSGNISYQPLGGGGTVTSVALTVPNIFAIAGSPITASGTLALSLQSQSANTVFAAPDGASGSPGFRALSAVDIPLLTATKISNFDATVRLNRLDQLAAPTASVAMGGQKLTGLAEPTQAQDAATKNYVDTAIIGATTYKGTVDGSAASPTVAGVAANPQNGWMYRVVTSGSTAFGFNVNVGDFVIYNGTVWQKIDSTDPSVSGTANRVTVTPTSDTNYQVDIASNYAGQSSITTLGTIATGVWQGTEIAVSKGGTGATTPAGARAALSSAGVARGSFTNATLSAEVLTVTHNLGQQFAQVEIYDNNNRKVTPNEITATSATVVTIDFTGFGALTGTWNWVAVG